MALYSIAANSDFAGILLSEPGKGTVLQVRTHISELGERKDQSSFPTFIKQDDGSIAVRGPRNIIRIACEFAIEARNDCSIRVGSPTEIAAALYEFGKATVSPSTCAFTTNTSSFSIAKRLCFVDTPATFAAIAHDLGLEMSDRSARRIMDGEIEPSANVLDRIKIESTMLDEPVPQKKQSKSSRKSTTHNIRVSLSNEDVTDLERGFQQAFNDFASKYYLLSSVEPTIKIVNGSLVISYPLVTSE